MRPLLLLICFCWWEARAYGFSSDDVTSGRDFRLPTQTLPQVEMNDTYQTAPQGTFISGILSSLTVTAVSEVGDKTFFIALVLALAHPPAYVYGGALTALALMTLLSASLGLIFSFLSSLWVHYLSALLFLLFGLKMLKDGCTMSSNAAKEELEEVQKTVETKMTGKYKGTMDVESGDSRMSVRWVFLEAFSMTFVSEWGDRSQIATVILAAKHNVVGVVLGSVLGHAACTLMAVVGGKLIADWISVRTVTLFGGVLFLAFAFTSLIGALEETLHSPTS